MGGYQMYNMDLTISNVTINVSDLTKSDVNNILESIAEFHGDDYILDHIATRSDVSEWCSKHCEREHVE